MRVLRPKPSPAVLLLVGSRRLRGLPVLVHEASRSVWGLRLRRTEQRLAISPRSCCLPPTQKRQRPDCIFSKLDTQPTYTPVYASPNTSRCATQNSGPSGSLLLSRRTLSFPASCRFIPGHHIGDFYPRLSRNGSTFAPRWACSRTPAHSCIILARGSK